MKPFNTMYSDGSPKPRFKRYYTGHKHQGAGKGDDQRPSQVDEQTLARNWCRTFGHKRIVTPEGRYGEWRCLDCGEEGLVTPQK